MQIFKNISFQRKIQCPSEFFNICVPYETFIPSFFFFILANDSSCIELDSIFRCHQFTSACFIAKHFQYRMPSNPLADSSPSEATETRRNARMAIGQKLCIPFIRSRKQQFTAIHYVRGIGDHSSEGSAGLPETRHRPPPPLEIRRGWRGSRLPSWLSQREGIARTGGTIFYELLARSKFVWMPPGYPERRFFLARQELGLAEKQEVVKGARLCLLSRVLKPSVCIRASHPSSPLPYAVFFRLLSPIALRVASKSVAPAATLLLSEREPSDYE